MALKERPVKWSMMPPSSCYMRVRLYFDHICTLKGLSQYPIISSRQTYIHRIFWNYSIIYFKILTTIIQRVTVPRLYTQHNTCRLSKSVGEAIFYSNHLQITDTLYLHNQDPIWIYTSCLHTGHEPWLMSHLSTHFKWKTWWHWGKDLAVSPTSISCKIRIYY